MQGGVEIELKEEERLRKKYFKIDHLFLTFLLKIIFQSVASCGKKNKEEQAERGPTEKITGKNKKLTVIFNLLFALSRFAFSHSRPVSVQ